MDRTNSNSKERAARADCESVLLVTATKSQPSAWRKSKRVLRLSVERSPPEDLGRRRRLIMTALPELPPHFGAETGIQGQSCWKVLAERTIRRESSAEIRQAEVRLISTAWRKLRRTIGRRPTVMLGGRKFIVQSGWPERLAIVLWRKLRDRQASLVTAVNRKAKVFRKVCGPISSPRG